MAYNFVEPYEYGFKSQSWVNGMPKSRLLKGAKVDPIALAKLPTKDLLAKRNLRNYKIVDKILASRKPKKTKEKQLTVTELAVERAKVVAKKRSIQLLSGLACSPNYARIYA